MLQHSRPRWDGTTIQWPLFVEQWNEFIQQRSDIVGRDGIKCVFINCLPPAWTNLFMTQVPKEQWDYFGVFIFLSICVKH